MGVYVGKGVCRGKRMRVNVSLLAQYFTLTLTLKIQIFIKNFSNATLIVHSVRSSRQVGSVDFRSSFIAFKQNERFYAPSWMHYDPMSFFQLLFLRVRHAKIGRLINGTKIKIKEKLIFFIPTLFYN
jgi:hypothetical protein